MINLTKEQLEKIIKAVEILQTEPDIKKIDGEFWIVYRVGSIVRIDIKTK